MEITFQTYQGRFLLRPDRALCKTFVGVLAKSLERYPVRLHAISVMSNHVHLLLSPRSVEQMSRFVQHLKTNVSKRVGQLRGWRGSLFGERFHSVPVSDEAAAQIARLRYLLSQGCKEGLVGRPEDWPGIQSATALATGRPLEGEWVDRDAYRSARRSDPTISPARFVERCEVHLQPLPVFADRPEADWRGEVRQMLESIEAETRIAHRAAGTRPVGRRKILRRDPEYRPARIPGSPAPRVHAFLRSVRLRMEEADRRFVEQYRAASRAYRTRADRTGARHPDIRPPGFPPDCWLPSIPSG